MCDVGAEYDEARKVYQRYTDAKEARRLADDCHAAVVEWRSASDYMTDDPFDRERYQHPKSRWLSPEKAAACQGVKHGLDEHGAVVATWNPWFHDRYDENRASSGFVRFEESTAFRIEFGPRGLSEGPEHVTKLTYGPDGQLVWKAMVWSKQGYVERFEWEGTRLERIVETRWSHGPCPPAGKAWTRGEVTRRTEERFTYDERGRVETIVSFEIDDEGRQSSDGTVRYQRPRKGETMAELSATITSALLEQIPAVIRRARTPGRFYCLLIGYTEEDFTAAWPPFLVLGSEAYLERTVARGDNVSYYLWAPDELRLLPENIETWLTDEALVRTCALQAQMMEMRGSTAAGRTVVRRVAKALNDVDWHGILETCDDFVVAAVENTGQRDVVKEVKGTVPKSTYRALRARRLI